MAYQVRYVLYVSKFAPKQTKRQTPGTCKISINLKDGSHAAKCGPFLHVGPSISEGESYVYFDPVV